MIHPKLIFVYGMRSRIFPPYIFPTLLPSFITKQKKEKSTTPLNSLGDSVKSKIIISICYWYKDRHINQWNKIESPETNFRIYDQMIF